MSDGIVVDVVPYATDNFAYLVRRTGSREAVVVDAGEARAVLAAARRADVSLVAVLSTHHHGDHVGGNRELAKAVPGLRIFGAAAAAERIPGLTDPLEPDAPVAVAYLELTAIESAGHTRGGLAFLGHGWVFTGDTLFGAGCGRLLEGTAAELLSSLGRIVERATPATRVGFGHEYTEKNLAFASAVEPANPAIAARVERARAARAAGRPTAPSTIAEELATNPFLRTHSAAIRARLGAVDATDLEVFAALRAQKDRF